MKENIIGWRIYIGCLFVRKGLQNERDLLFICGIHHTV